jgi:hypothetical protein
MLDDHVCDEFRLSNRFSVENGYKMFKENLRVLNPEFNKVPENQLKKISFVNIKNN